MDQITLEKRIDSLFKKRIRLVAENSKGQFSSTWMFWGNRNDFYFGSKSLLGSFKVSLHENGNGYVGYHKPFFQARKAEGIEIPVKTALEWVLPIPGPLGAVHVASLLLPSDYCRSEPLSESAKKKTLVFGLEDGCTAEIGVFFSNEEQSTLEAKLVLLGRPIVAVTLENKLKVSIVARSKPFNPSVLPSDEQLRLAKRLLLQRSDEFPDNDNLNAMLWNKPADGEALQVVDVGGVRWNNKPTNVQQ